MTVILATWARFHFFNLARELERAGVLKLLYTSYPPFLGKRFGISPRLIRGSYVLEPLMRTYSAITRASRQDHFTTALQMRWEANLIRTMPPCDIFVGLSGFCTGSLAAARDKGAVAVLERASSHIRVQAAILAEEKDLTGLDIAQVSALDIEREEQGYELADYILVPSSFCLSSFKQQGFAGRKLLMQPLGVDLSAFSPAQAGSTAAPSTLRTISTGGFSARKGMHYLMAAARELDPARFSFKHVGPLIDLAPAAGNLPPNFELHPSVPQSDLARHYRSADVFVLPTLEDGFPTVIPQAMACGLPVITTPHGSGPDIIIDGYNGFIVPIRDPAALVERLTALQADPARCRQMGINARKTVIEGYSWEDYGKRTIQMYNTLRN